MLQLTFKNTNKTIKGNREIKTSMTGFMITMRNGKYFGRDKSGVELSVLNYTHTHFSGMQTFLKHTSSLPLSKTF